jgi:hypothetical protein
MNYPKRRTWLPFLVLITLATPVGTLQAQTPASELVTTKGTVVSRETSPGAWLLELDRSVQTATGRVRSVALIVDETRAPAHPIGVGDRLEIEGRLLVPPLPGGLIILEPTRVTQLADPGLKHAYYLFRGGKSEGCAECYVPLLLSASPIGTSTATPEAEVIVTYERDSIWEIRDGPATLTELEPRARTLRLDGRPYRYQEVSPEEAIRLLKNPLGSIPISRLNVPTATRCRALLLRMGVREP